MSLVLTDAQLDAWIEANGPVPQGYGQLTAFLHQCDKEHQAMEEALKHKLTAPEAPKLYFVPGRGLQDVPF